MAVYHPALLGIALQEQHASCLENLLGRADSIARFQTQKNAADITVAPITNGRATVLQTRVSTHNFSPANLLFIRRPTWERPHEVYTNGTANRYHRNGGILNRVGSLIRKKRPTATPPSWNNLALAELELAASSIWARPTAPTPKSRQTFPRKRVRASAHIQLPSAIVMDTSMMTNPEDDLEIAKTQVAHCRYLTGQNAPKCPTLAPAKHAKEDLPRYRKRNYRGELVAQKESHKLWFKKFNEEMTLAEIAVQREVERDEFRQRNMIRRDRTSMVFQVHYPHDLSCVSEQAEEPSVMAEYQYRPYYSSANPRKNAIPAIPAKANVIFSDATHDNAAKFDISLSVRSPAAAFASVPTRAHLPGTYALPDFSFSDTSSAVQFDSTTTSSPVMSRKKVSIGSQHLESRKRRSFGATSPAKKARSTERRHTIGPMLPISEELVEDKSHVTETKALNDDTTTTEEPKIEADVDASLTLPVSDEDERVSQSVEGDDKSVVLAPNTTIPPSYEEDSQTSEHQTQADATSLLLISHDYDEAADLDAPREEDAIQPIIDANTTIPPSYEEDSQTSMHQTQADATSLLLISHDYDETSHADASIKKDATQPRIGPNTTVTPPSEDEEDAAEPTIEGKAKEDAETQTKMDDTVPSKTRNSIVSSLHMLSSPLGASTPYVPIKARTVPRGGNSSRRSSAAFTPINQAKARTLSPRAPLGARDPNSPAVASPTRVANPEKGQNYGGNENDNEMEAEKASPTKKNKTNKRKAPEDELPTGAFAPSALDKLLAPVSKRRRVLRSRSSRPDGLQEQAQPAPEPAKARSRRACKPLKSLSGAKAVEATDTDTDAALAPAAAPRRSSRLPTTVASSSPAAPIATGGSRRPPIKNRRQTTEEKALAAQTKVNTQFNKQGSAPVSQTIRSLKRRADAGEISPQAKRTKSAANAKGVTWPEGQNLTQVQEFSSSGDEDEEVPPPRAAAPATAKAPKGGKKKVAAVSVKGRKPRQKAADNEEDELSGPEPPSSGDKTEPSVEAAPAKKKRATKATAATTTTTTKAAGRKSSLPKATATSAAPAKVAKRGVAKAPATKKVVTTAAGSLSEAPRRRGRSAAVAK